MSKMGFIFVSLFTFTSCKKWQYPDKHTEIAFQKIKSDSTIMYKFGNIDSFSSYYAPKITKNANNFDVSEIYFLLDSAKKEQIISKNKDTSYIYPKVWYFKFSPKTELTKNQIVEIERPFCYGDEDCATWYYEFIFQK